MAGRAAEQPWEVCRPGPRQWGGHPGSGRANLALGSRARTAPAACAAAQWKVGMAVARSSRLAVPGAGRRAGGLGGNGVRRSGSSPVTLGCWPA